MSFVFRSWLSAAATVSAALVLWSISTSALAQQDAAPAAEGVRINPYTGPPIYLDETEVLVAPSFVRHERVQEKYDDGNLRIERQIAHYSDNSFKADGVYREFYPNGQLFVEGRYREGRQHGEWTYYFDNGQINRKATFKDGKPDGPREVYRADGTLAAKRNYRDGNRHGEWITYDETGTKPLAEEHYDDGKVDGVWKTWHSNGRLKQEVSFRQGERHGTSTEWDENGNKRAELTFVDNKLHGTVTRWLPDGRQIVQRFDEGRLISQSGR